jgi:hypothetical protein
MSRKDTIKEIKSMQAAANGKLFIAMVHQIYGPLRGLNYIIEGANPERILDMIDEAKNPTKMEEVERRMKQAKSGLPPKDMKDLITQIWTVSSLATVPMVLPFEMVKDAETKPVEVTSINQGMLAIHKKLNEDRIKAHADFYFYRVGTI